jgi:hypothetical protein
MGKGGQNEPVEGPGRAGHRILKSLTHYQNPRLPRAFSNVLDAIQDEVPQFDVSCTDTPFVLDFSHPLVGLFHRYVASVETVFDPKE